MRLIETHIFTEDICTLLDDDEYRLFQNTLLKNPDLGSIVRNSGGIRKVRWKLAGRGKRGGLRIMYYYISSNGVIHLLYVFKKKEKSDLTAVELSILRKMVKEELA